MASSNHLKSPLSKSSLTMMLFMLIVILASLIGSFQLFLGYLGGGRSLIGLFYAFALCFGAGAILYIPATLIFLMARSVRANGPQRNLGRYAFILALPIWVFGGLALIYYPQFWVWAILALASGLYISFWALIVIRHGL